MQFGDREDRGLLRIDVATDDRLECLRERYGNHHRVNRLLRHGAMRAATYNGDVETARRGHGDTRRGTNPSGFGVGPIVDGVDFLAGKSVEQAIFHHRGGAAQTLLGRLKDHMHPPGEIASLSKIPSCS